MLLLSHLLPVVSYYLPALSKNTEVGVAAIITLVTFLLMTLAQFSSGMLVFFFLIRGATYTVYHWSSIFNHGAWDV